MILPILIHASPTLIHALPILLHWLGFRLSAPYLNTLNRHESFRQQIRIEHPRQPIKNEYYVTRVLSQSKSNTLGSRQPIRIEYYVTRVISQSALSVPSPELSITPPDRSWPWWRSLLGSRLESSRYSLFQYIGTSTPRDLISSHSYYSCITFACSTKHFFRENYHNF